MMKFLTVSVLCVTLAAAADEPKRPKITGIGHIALFVHDIEKSRQFYKDFLGYGEPFKLDNPDGSLSLTFIKVNERQYIELFPEKTEKTDRLNHISIETDNAEAMRVYLASKGVKVPEKITKGRIKNSNFNIKDPDGHTVEIVQYEPDGWSMREKGKFMDGPRISTHIKHLGIIVGKLDPAIKFYTEILGFKETWRGSKDGKTLNWVNMKLPESDDYIEFMLYEDFPSLSALGTAHHICFEVDSVEKAKADLESRPGRKFYTKQLDSKTGVNRKRQMNLFDPDGTRSEVMEPTTIDGKPTPPATAPPPQH